MKKEEFIEWFKSNTCYERCGNDDSWRYMVDYADYRFDYIDIESDCVTYSWEELYWGGSSSERREFTFEEFIEAYNNDSIRW